MFTSIPASSFCHHHKTQISLLRIFPTKNNASFCNFHRKYKFLCGEEKILANGSSQMFKDDSCLMIYFMEKKLQTRRRKCPILWMQHTGRIHLCKFYAKAATKAQINFNSFL
jgi:hypothetical protein